MFRAAALALALGCATPVAAQQSQGCFVGADAVGAPAQLVLQAEQYGESFEVWGQVSSPTIGVMQIKADGWSGAGRLFRGHEGEAGALYVQITDFTAQGLVLQVEGYGSFPFRAVAC